MERYEAIIFDLDGTLYESRRLPLRLVLGDLRHALTLRAERRARRELMGRDYGTPEALYDALFRAIAQRRGIAPEAAAAWYQDRYMPLMVAVLTMYYEARPCAAQLLADLRAQGIRTFVLSDYGCVEAKLAAVGLDAALFDGVIDAPALGGLKPCREVFGRMMERYSLRPDTTLMVGDRDDTDGAGARAVGMDFRCVRRRADWDALLRDFLIAPSSDVRS